MKSFSTIFFPLSLQNTTTVQQDSTYSLMIHKHVDLQETFFLQEEFVFRNC